MVWPCRVSVTLCTAVAGGRGTDAAAASTARDKTDTAPNSRMTLILRWRGSVVEMNGGIGTEAFVVAVSDGEANALRPGTEPQRVIGHGRGRKPVLSIHPDVVRCEMREQILRFRGADLRHRLALGSNYREIGLVHPEQTI